MQQLLLHSMDLEYNLKMTFKSNGLQACEGDKTLYLIDLCKCGQLQIKKILISTTEILWSAAFTVSTYRT